MRITSLMTELQNCAAELLRDNARLERELERMTASRDAARRTRWHVIAVAVCVGLVLGAVAGRASALDATVLHVVDGDTYDIAGELWPGQVLTRERVRLADWDTPEPGGRADCPREAELAAQATAMVRRMMAEAGMRVYVQHTGERGSLGRPLVHIWIDGQSLGIALAEAGLARRFERGRAEGWCDE